MAASRIQEAADKELFDDIAKSYVRKDLTTYCRIARKQRLMTSLSNVRRPIASILEIGCGAGFTADYLKDEYQTYLGLDYSENLIAYAERFNSSSNTEFHCINIKDYDTDNCFQVILMIGVLHHIPDPDQVLNALKKLLHPEGVLIVNEPQKGNPLISLLRYIRKRIDPKYSVDQVEFTEKELRSLFSKCGYHVRVFPQGILSTPLAETQFLPHVVGMPLAKTAQLLDPVLEYLLRLPLLRALAWNVVVEARLQKPDEDVDVTGTPME